MLLKRFYQRLFFSTFSSRYQHSVAFHRENGEKHLAKSHYHMNASCIDGKSQYRHKNPGVCGPLHISSLMLPSKSMSTPTFRTDNNVLPGSTPIEISWMMLPDDSNIAGNVHGGTVLKMLEQAGNVITSRHCNQGTGTNGNPISTVLARLEKMNFHHPILVGEVAQLQAAISYTSSHSLEVVVDVWAENVLMGQRRHTNTATLWFVPVTAEPQTLVKMGDHQLGAVVAPVPQLKGLSEAEKEAGKCRYETQKASREVRSNGKKGDSNKEVPVGDAMAISSQSTVANMVLPLDCTLSGRMMGGALMKLMADTAGICASKHFYGDAVTAYIDAINFHQPVTCGDILFVTTRKIFTSSRSIEIEVTTEVEGLKSIGRHVTNTAYFTFLCLGKDGRAISVPPLQCGEEDEKARFEEGKQRYMARKKAQMEAMNKLPNQY